MISDGTTYGFAYNGKIYLNPDFLNSNVAVHEYTHLWDKYIQNTNPELWERGKEAFKKTSLWEQVKSDPSYTDIAGDEDLVLSECHARICGEIAQSVLEKIAREDGRIAKDTVIDWDKETWTYIAQNFTRDIASFIEVKDFMNLPIRDLMNEKIISYEQATPAKESGISEPDNLEAEKQLLSRFMPPEQLFTTLDLLAGEEGSFFAGKIKEIATAIESAPKIYETDGMKEHPVILRYFHPTGTETLVCEIGADGEAFGYQVINGDWVNSEFEYLDINEIKSIPGMEIDYHFPENMSIERWLYTQSPEHFRQYAELDTISKYREKHPFDKNVYSKKLSSHLEKTCEQIDEYISSGKLPEDSRFILPSTPEYLLKTGAKNTNITIAASVIKKAVNVHGLSSQQIKNAIYKLYDPVIVFESDRTKSENKAESRLILTDEWKDGKPVALAVNVNSDVQFRKDSHRVFLEVQDIRSIHDRELVAKNGTDLIQKWIKDGLCRYVDDKKISDWSTVNKVYFPIEALQSDGNNIIQKSNLVNQTIQKSPFFNNFLRIIHKNY